MKVLGICGLVVLACVSVGRAEPLSYFGAGRLTDVDWLSTLRVGDPVEIGLSIDVQAADPILVEEHIAAYDGFDSIVLFSVDTTGEIILFSCLDLIITVSDEHPEFGDSLAFFGFGDIDSICVATDLSDAITTLGITLIDEDGGNAITGLELPEGPIDLAAFPTRELGIEGCLLSPCSEFDADFFEVRGSIDILDFDGDPEPVPEPAQTTLALTALATLAALAALRRRHG